MRNLRPRRSSLNENSFEPFASPRQDCSGSSDFAKEIRSNEGSKSQDQYECVKCLPKYDDAVQGGGCSEERQWWNLGFQLLKVPRLPPLWFLTYFV